MLNHTATAAAKPKNGQQAQNQVARRSRRDKLMAMAQLWSGDKPEVGASTQVLVSNISLEGVAVRTNEPLIKGAIHFVRMTAGPLRLETPIKIGWRRSADGLGLQAAS